MIRFSRLLADGRTAQVVDLTLGRVRLYVGKDPDERFTYDDGW